MEASYSKLYFALIFLSFSAEILVHYTANDSSLLRPSSFIACRYPAITSYKTSRKAKLIMQKAVIF
jgi:hypothetical protein